MMGNIAKDDEVELAHEKLKKSWKKYRSSGKGSALFKAVIYAYKGKNLKSHTIYKLERIFLTNIY